jgi:hypothetical protein
MSSAHALRLPVVAVLIALALWPGVARADKPDVTREPLSYAFVTEVCGFDVRIESEGTSIVLDFGNRQITVLPGTKATLTNLESGTVIELHSLAGPEFHRTGEDGSTVVSTGPWIWGPVHPVTGEPGIWHLTGRLVMIYDAAGVVIDATFTGRERNLCEDLAA